MELCPENVVHLGPHIVSMYLLSPGLAAPRPWYMVWEEFSGHVLQDCCFRRYLDLFIPCIPLWFCEVWVKIACHQQICPPVVLSYDPNNMLYWGGVLRGQLTTHNKPVPPPWCQLKYGDVQSMLLVVLCRKARQLAVENHHASTVLARRTRHYHHILWLLLHVYSISDIGLLNKYQFNFGLICST